jgi:hypothetical protein
MREDDRTYYQRRAEEELRAAELAGDEQAATIHRALAARYHQLGRGASELPLELVSEPRPAPSPLGQAADGIPVDPYEGIAAGNRPPSPAPSSRLS